MTPAVLRLAVQGILRRLCSPRWGAVIWGSAAIALFALYSAMRWPQVAGLVEFLGVTIVVNGPLSPLFPATYEPVLMLAGRSYPPFVVAVVGTAGTLYIEFINYYIYRFAVLHPRLERARGTFWVRKSVQLFRRCPFFAIWLMALTPLPYWVARILGPLTRYPIQRYLLATFLGRFPRLWFYAALGLWIPVPATVLQLWLLAVTCGALAVAALRRRRNARASSTMR